MGQQGTTLRPGLRPEEGTPSAQHKMYHRLSLQTTLTTVIPFFFRDRWLEAKRGTGEREKPE